MASLSTGRDGLKRILFMAPDGTRKTLRLGRMNNQQCTAVLSGVEGLLTEQITGHRSTATAAWLTTAGPDLIDRLGELGLLAGHDVNRQTLGQLLDEYFSAAQIKPGTKTTYLQTRAALEAHFTPTRPIRSIAALDAEKFRQALVASGLATATTAKRIRTARQMFKCAIRWGMIDRNPFADVVGGTQTNRARQHFIDTDTARRVLAACPSNEWRLLFALSRWGGLRCPSEHLRLRWEDVLWDRDRIKITSPKTEANIGGDHRYIPIFPELRPLLMEAFEKAQDGAEYVIEGFRGRGAAINLRTHLLRIIARAGVKAWPRLMHNLRASRQTELAQTFPGHVVCAWLGNSQAVAQSHYLMTCDTDFAKASAQPIELSLPTKQATQNPTQTPPETPFQTETQGKANRSKSPRKSGLQVTFGELQPAGVMTPRGFEPL